MSAYYEASRLGSKEFILNCLYFVLLDLHLTVMSVEDLVTPYALPLFVILNVGASYSAFIFCVFLCIRVAV